MDSRLLAGAYSKRYKYIDQDQLNLKTDNDLETADVLAKARRLSQETNKRRKLLAQKRKQEAAREEKRRQEILNRRHQEQKQATEKYQRCHVGTRPRFSPRRRGHSPTRNHVNLEDALRLVRGGSSSTSPTEQSREAIQRMYNNQQNGRDPLERSQVRSSRASSAGQKEGRQSQSRPLSGRPLDASIRAQLMERSMHNLTSSRSRFEQQLEQHQQLLVEQQQKSLRDFNQAIRQEIDADTKVQGLEENEAYGGPLQSESLSSLDSLEEGNRSLGNSFQEHQAQGEFHQVSEKQREAYQNHSDTGRFDNSVMQPKSRAVSVEAQSSQERPGRPQSVRVPVSRQEQDAQRHGGGHSQADSTAMNGHIVGPIPQGYYNPPAHVPPSSTPVIQGNLNNCPDSLDINHSSPERRVTVGTALRLPQQSPPVDQPIKQPPPALQYDSQLLAHRKFELHSSQNRGGTVSQNCNVSGNRMNSNQQETNSKYTATKLPEELTSALTQNEQPKERPKAHIYAWTSPPPEENEQEPNSTSISGQSNCNNNYSANMVADRVMATNLHPQTCRTISTAATTTWVYQTVNSAHNMEPTYSQSSVSNNMPSSHQTSFGTHSSHAEIPKGQGQKPGTVLTSTGTYPATTGLKFVASMPASYQTHVQASENKQHGGGPAADNHHQNQSHATSGKDNQQHKGGSIAQGTLGLVNGRLTTIENTQADNAQQEQKITVVEDEADGRKEVRSILKKMNRDGSKGTGTVQTTFNVQDSLEIAKIHMRSHEQVKRRKAQKKGVRFADLHYPEVEEDTDSVDSMTDISNNHTQAGFPADGKTADMKGMPQRARPASARVMSFNPKGADMKTKGPRVASAGPARHSPATRPKAAAHIIMSGDASSQHNQHGTESGITVHKSQLDKKVTLINNNFMSRVPVYSSAAATSTPAPASAAAVYAVSGSKGGGSVSSTTAADSANNGANGQGRNSTYGQPSRGKSTVPTLHSTTVLPSHSHFSNANNTYKPVYNENGMRIDRTPTDDEINNLWKNMRTMLDVNDGKGATPTSTSSNNEQTTRPQVQVSHQYIDGASLGIPNGMGRVAGYTNAKSSPVANGPSKAGGQNKNGYLQRYSLLQQRRTPATTGLGVSSRTNDVVEQTVQPMPLSSNGSDPRYPAVNVSYAPREEMSESMAGFLAAEQAVQSQGADVRDSRVYAAMDSAQNQQEMYNSIRQKVAKGGPSALSLEEHRLLESLDKLNDRLKAVESRQTNNQQAANYSNNSASHQIYVHGSGFRGHQVITNQSYRRNSGGMRSMGRPVSARLLTRPYR